MSLATDPFDSWPKYICDDDRTQVIMYIGENECVVYTRDWVPGQATRYTPFSYTQRLTAGWVRISGHHAAMLLAAWLVKR